MARIIARAALAASVAASGCWGGAGVAIPPPSVAPPSQVVAAKPSAPRLEPVPPVEVRLLEALAELASAEPADASLADLVRSALERRGCRFAGPLREADAGELTIRLASCEGPDEPLEGVVRVAFVPDPAGVRARVELDGATLDGQVWDGTMWLMVGGGDVRLEELDASARAPEALPAFQPLTTSIGFGPAPPGPMGRPPLLRAIEGTFEVLLLLTRIAAAFG